MDLNDVLGDAPIATVDPEPTDVKPEPEKVEETAAPSAATETKAEETTPEPSAQRDDKGRFAKTEPAAPIAALIEERRKRQELEAELQQYRASKPKTDFFDDPAKATTEHVREAVTPLEQQVVELRVELQRLKNPDYDEVMMLVLNKAKDDPLLKHRIDTAPDPYSFIYREGKRMKELDGVDGDITKYREKVLAEQGAKVAELETRFKALEAENQALKASIAKRDQVPQSLNSEPSAAGKADTFAGPTPLGNILNS